MLGHSGARLILVDEDFAHLIPKQLPEGVQVILSRDTGGTKGVDASVDPYEAFLDAGRKRWASAEEEEGKRFGNKAKRGWELIDIVEDENEACALCYTSGENKKSFSVMSFYEVVLNLVYCAKGTTGRPKGVLTSHRGSYLAAVANAFEAQLTGDSVYLWVLPAFHAAGWTFPWAVTAALGTHYILRRVDNDQIWDALNHGGVTHYCGAPTVQIGLVNHPKAKRLEKGVKVAIAASAPTADLLAKLEALNFTCVHVYGQTENYGPFSRRYREPSWSDLSVEERARLMARQGHGFLVVDEVRVVRRPPEDDSSSSSDAAMSDKKDERELIDVARDGKEIGEIIMRGNLAMLEYFKDDDATRKTIKHGWLHTGDLAVRYPGGEVAIADRAKDIIISGGENISSLMVEQELADHADVLEVCVVARPHERWGEVGHAFVVLKEGRKGKVDKEVLRSHCETRMSKVSPAW